MLLALAAARGTKNRTENKNKAGAAAPSSGSLQPTGEAQGWGSEAGCSGVHPDAALHSSHLRLSLPGARVTFPLTRAQLSSHPEERSWGPAASPKSTAGSRPPPGMSVTGQGRPSSAVESARLRPTLPHQASIPVTVSRCPPRTLEGPRYPKKRRPRGRHVSRALGLLSCICPSLPQ